MSKRVRSRRGTLWGVALVLAGGLWLLSSFWAKAPPRDSAALSPFSPTQKSLNSSLLFGSLARAASRDSTSRCGPLLRWLLSDRRGGAILARQPPQINHLSLLRPLFTVAKPKEREQIRVLLDYTGPTESLRQAGVETTARAGTIYAAWVPLALLPQLVRLPHLQRMEASRTLYPHLNLSAAAVMAPRARSLYGLDGRNVIVGIVDTGIDYRLPAFRHADGTTRIHSILDFSVLETVGDKKRPRVFSQKEINRALLQNKPLGHEDTQGHGTHVAGIAAGNGRTSQGSDRRYVGLAPGADLVIVKATRPGSGSFDSADVLEGIAYIYRVASLQGKAYVINLSLGGHTGGHDGTTLLERSIDAFSGPGRQGQVIVVSAGNEGQDKIHATGRVFAKETTELQFEISPHDPPTEKKKSTVLLEIWYPDISSLQATVRSPRGERVGPFALSEHTASPQKMEDGFLFLDHVARKKEPAANRISLGVSGSKDRPLREGVWTIELTGETSRFDAWIAESSIKGGSVRFSSHVSPRMLVGVPGSARWGITVGAYNTRAGWNNILGEPVDTGVTVGALSPFSSPGPTRDGRPKPEIVAPGMFVAAPASGFVHGSTTRSLDGAHVISQGTSQAAPHVTGAIALLLQAAPHLDAPSVRNLLIRGASTDSFTQRGAVYAPQWGFGKLDIYTSLWAHFSRSLGPPHPGWSTIGAVFPLLPADGKASTPLYVLPKDPAGMPLHYGHQVQFRTTLGTISGPTRQPEAGVYQGTLVASESPGVATVSAWIDGVRLHATATVTFGLPRPQKEDRGCSCAAASPPGAGQTNHPPPSAWLLLLFLLGLYLATRRLMKRPSQRP